MQYSELRDVRVIPCDIALEVLVAEHGVVGDEGEHDNVERHDDVHQAQHGQQHPAGRRTPRPAVQSINNLNPYQLYGMGCHVFRVLTTSKNQLTSLGTYIIYLIPAEN